MMTLVLILVMLFGETIVEGLGMHSYSNMNITEGTALAVADVTHSCACRTVCGDDCTAVTAVKKSEESFSCYVTTDHLTDLSLSEGSGASTYFKAKHCTAPCSLISGLGLISFTTTEGYFNDYPEHCGKGVSLYSPDSIERYEILRLKLMENPPTELMCYWIDATLKPADMKFYWANGEPLPESKSVYPYGNNEPSPNLEEQCMVMFFIKDREDLQFHMADMSCIASNVLCRFICDNNPDPVTP